MQANKLVLPVKNKDGEVIKTVEAQTFNIYFGTISNLMEVLDIGEESSSFEVLKKVSTAWKQVVEILSDVFPDMEKSDWQYVRLNDLVPVMLEIVKYTFAEIMQIPSESKN